MTWVPGQLQAGGRRRGAPRLWVPPALLLAGCTGGGNKLATQTCTGAAVWPPCCRPVVPQSSSPQMQAPPVGVALVPDTFIPQCTWLPDCAQPQPPLSTVWYRWLARLACLLPSAQCHTTGGVTSAGCTAAGSRGLLLLHPAACTNHTSWSKAHPPTQHRAARCMQPAPPPAPRIQCKSPTMPVCHVCSRGGQGLLPATKPLMGRGALDLKTTSCDAAARLPHALQRLPQYSQPAARI
jgi:hypothetical protein